MISQSIAATVNVAVLALPGYSAFVADRTPLLSLLFLFRLSNLGADFTVCHPGCSQPNKPASRTEFLLLMLPKNNTHADNTHSDKPPAVFVVPDPLFDVLMTVCTHTVHSFPRPPSGLEEGLLLQLAS